MKRAKTCAGISVGVIGYGGAFNMGKAHLDEMRDAGMTPTAVAEIDPARLEAARSDFPGIETYTSVAAMLRKSAVQLLAIITPHNTHARLALQCLRAGRHVVCEKPFAITTAECDAMIAAARRRRLMVTAYHNRHWDGCVMRAVQTIRSGAIGEVVRIDAARGGYVRPADWWRSSKSISGGVLYDWGVHFLEYALQIADADIAEVSGFAKRGHWAPEVHWKEDTNEDEGFAVVRFVNGRWLTLRITMIDARAIDAKGGDRWLTITGTRGLYAFNYTHWDLMTVTDGVKTTTHGTNPQDEGGRFYRNVADYLTKGSPLVITPEWARRPIHILDLADRSAKRGVTLRALYK
jgi:scyllo-inositol 2-dehydrogenase (NADP+)